MSRNYPTPTVPASWADTRETDDAVAQAIHAIASGDRTPEAIWEAPTLFEWDHVCMAVNEYVPHGDYPADERGYCWGQEIVPADAE